MSLYKILKTAVKEEDVNYIYRTFLAKKQIGCEIPYISQHTRVKVDGVLRLSDFLMLLEFKYDKDFTKRSNVIEVIIQILYYLKRFEEFGDDLPDVCFVGDINECFCFHSNDITEYLSLDTNWSLAPSVAGKTNVDLFELLYENKNINPFVHELDDNFKINSLLEEAVNLSKSLTQKKRITEKNINELFNYFIKRILRGKKFNEKTANELVNIFITTILNKNENYIHPHKPNTLVTKSFGNIIVNGGIFRSFFKHYQRDYSIKERDRLTAVCDRLIEDSTRRFQGEFFTPTEWVDEAHRMIEDGFGEGWKDKYVVWDPACGSGNLTRDYKFKELYCSTLNQSDIDIMNQMHYNPESVKFQFDFLNDPDDKLPKSLKSALKAGKKILVLMNPPYGTAKSGGAKKDNNKIGIANTKIGILMQKNDMGKCSAQLYAQFMYKIMRLNSKNISIAIFSPSLYKIGKSWKLFRKDFYSRFRFLDGMLFNASNFSNTKSVWGIDFSLWKNGNENRYRLPIKVKSKNSKGIIETNNIKNLYSLENDSIRAANWVRKLTIKTKNIESYPNLTSALKVKDKFDKKVSLKGYLGGYVELSNSVYQNISGVSLGSAISLLGYTVSISIYSYNFLRCISIFTAKKSIKSNWINQKDEYLAPNTEHPNYEQWNNDCLVYSLFNNSSNQSSLRDITYKNKQWDIINEWFWCPKKHIQSLAEEYKINEIEQDMKNFGQERFVYNKLKETHLSDDAIQVLNKAVTLVTDSFQYRKMMIEEYPEYHLNTWDAGWYQIKKILKKYMPDEFKDFVKLYKEFENRMREGVYKFGFLKE